MQCPSQAPTPPSGARRIEVIGPGGGYMISSANSLTSYCKVENVWAMARAIRRYAPYPPA